MAKERNPPVYCDHCGQPGARDGVLFGDGPIWRGPIYRLHYGCDVPFRKKLIASAPAHDADDEIDDG
jgi:hypothetical protein